VIFAKLMRIHDFIWLERNWPLQSRLDACRSVFLAAIAVSQEVLGGL